MECSKCGEEVTRDEDGGWQMLEDRMEVFAHYGMCPAEKDELWKRIYLERWNAVMERPLDAGLVEAEAAVEAVVESL
jgi:hypothetical protein